MRGQKRRASALLVLLAVAAMWVLKRPHWSEYRIGGTMVYRQPTGEPQLISADPIHAMEGEICQWAPAAAKGSMTATLAQTPSRGAASNDASRPPVRVIHDTYPTYSAVAVDPIRNEIVLQDENLFQIMVYDRNANTLPNATMTEPKRTIGGHNTKVEFNCALYIDPKTGDIYSVNNDTTDDVVVFSHDARGDVAPTRELYTPHGSYGIAVDEQKQELFISVEHTNAVAVYRQTAQNDENPLRILQGEHTGLEDPHGLAIDSKHQLLFVANHGNARMAGASGGGVFHPPSITVYPLSASGDTRPMRVIQGAATKLDWPAQVFFDVEAQELFVANDADDSIIVFAAEATGDATPLRIIKGPKTGIKNPTGVFVDTKNKELVVSNMGNHSATVYPRNANGDIAPLRTIRNAPRGKLALAIGNPGAVAYDSKRDEILVPN